MKIAGCHRIVTWGGRTDKHSHRHIWAAYDRAARKLSMEALWLPGTDDDRLALGPGDLVFCLDQWDHGLYPAVKACKYVLHNFNGSHPLFESLEPDQFVRLQVTTKHSAGEKIGPCRYWLAENRTLSMPWGTDLFAEEFYDPVFNATSRDAVFVGAVWDTAGQGNANEIAELKTALTANGLTFVHRTQISDAEMVQVVRGARIAPAVAGAWQVENDYLPCRCFKNSSYGTLIVTNVGRFYDIYSGCSLQSKTIPELVEEAMSLKRGEYVEMVLAQQKITAKFTYRESLAAIDEVFSR